MEEIIRFIFWFLVESLLFRLGRLYLRILTFGKVKITKPSPVMVFIVAIFGIVFSASMIAVIYSISR